MASSRGSSGRKKAAPKPAPKKPAKRLERLEDLMPDPENANRGTERGLGMLEHSLTKFGAGRSVLADRDGRVIAGNKTVERAVALGLKARFVRTNGRELVVVVRDDVDARTKAGRELAVADNRVAQLDLAWDVDVLKALEADGVDLEQFFFPDERALLFDIGARTETEAPTEFPIADAAEIGAALKHECPKCHFRFPCGGKESQAPKDDDDEA